MSILRNAHVAVSNWRYEGRTMGKQTCCSQCFILRVGNTCSKEILILWWPFTGDKMTNSEWVWTHTVSNSISVRLFYNKQGLYSMDTMWRYTFEKFQESGNNGFLMIWWMVPPVGQAPWIYGILELTLKYRPQEAHVARGSRWDYTPLQILGGIPT